MSVSNAFGREENILGKGRNAGYQHFLLFPTISLKALFLRVIKSLDWVAKRAGEQKGSGWQKGASCISVVHHTKLAIT